MTRPTPTWVSETSPTSRRARAGCPAVVLSIQTRQVLGYSLSDRMPDDLVEQPSCSSLAAVIQGQGVLFHSDRGSQYASGDCRRTLRKLWASCRA